MRSDRPFNNNSFLLTFLAGPPVEGGGLKYTAAVYKCTLRSKALNFFLIVCYSLDRTLEIHGAANTKQIQEKCTVASNRAPPSGTPQ